MHLGLSPLWISCATENASLSSYFLSLGIGSEDTPGPDGTTAFALAIAHQNQDLLQAKKEGCMPTEDMVTKCRDMVKTSPLTKKLAGNKPGHYVWVNC